jgi:hypothetical protein
MLALPSESGAEPMTPSSESPISAPLAGGATGLRRNACRHRPRVPRRSGRDGRGRF